MKQEQKGHNEIPWDSLDFLRQIGDNRHEIMVLGSENMTYEEERISKRRALELYDTGRLDTLTPGTFEALAEIHRYLFSDIYDFAGQIRSVNLAKGNFRFAPAIYLRAAVDTVSHMPQSTFDEIIQKYVEMNVAHPFREGNGRATRLWLDAMLKKELGVAVDWSKVDKEDYLLAMERSPIKDLELKFLLKSALTDRISDREIYMNGIDASYSYEGCDAIRTEDIAGSPWTTYDFEM